MNLQWLIGYFENGLDKQITYFDLFFRDTPDNGGYAIMAGLQQVIDYIENLKFDDDDIAYLSGLNKFSDKFLDYLKNFKFSGDIWAIPEGTPVFPNEPLMVVRAPVIEAQILETMLLLTINHQSLIATKTSRIVGAADGRAVLEFGARRAHGVDAAVFGARAAIISGAVGTSCTRAAELFNVPALGTMAHSWIQTFPSEYDAFLAYAKIYPNDATFLVDTYNVLESGIPNTIKVFEKTGIKPKGVRLDSGDLAYLSKKAREMLDNAGLTDCKIVASNALDENLIKSLIAQGARIDSFGVGENLITSQSDPVFGGVYKLSAIEQNGTIVPKIKISENPGKLTLPSFKKVYRLYDNDTNKALADVITLYDEEIPLDNYTIFDPEAPWKKKTLTNYTACCLLVDVYKNGKMVYNSISVHEISKYREQELNTIWDEVKRIDFPTKYYVDLSQKLWDLRDKMLNGG